MSLPLPIESLLARVTAAWRERAVALKAVSFALVGLVNTAVDAAVFFLLLAYVTSSRVFVDAVAQLVTVLEPYVTSSFTDFLVENAFLIIANVAAWFVANTGSYVMNSLTTFSAETDGKLRLKHYAGFVGSGLVAVTASTVTVVIAAKFMPVWAAKAIAILVSFVVNFTITHFVVFPPRTGAAEKPQ